MEGKTKQKKSYKICKMRDDNDVQKRTYSEILYKKKFSTPMKKRRKNTYNPQEEARLEREVFGDSNNFIKNLLKEESTTEVKDEPTDTYNENLVSDEEIESNDDDSSVVNTEDAGSEEKKAAWDDDDDNNYTVDAALDAQNRKLTCKRPEKLYTTYLKNHYEVFVGTPKWAKLGTTTINEDDDDDSDVLKHCQFLDYSKPMRLPKDIIDVKQLSSLNKSNHVQGHVVTSVEFHSKYTLALVAGTSGVVSLFEVDGHTNKHVFTVLNEKTPVSKAVFMKEGQEILIGSHYYKYFNTFDITKRQVLNIPLPYGITNTKDFEVSPNSNYIALCGRKGEIFLLDGTTKELISRFNMNSKCRTLAFTPDNKNLISHGDGGEMYIWDLNSRVCVHRAIDDGCLSGTSLAVSPNGQFVATGSAQGVVNLYKTNTLLEKRNPTPVKVIMNLVTGITSLRFNRTCEILAMASDKKCNAFRMMHVPSLRVFANFPAHHTDMGMPQSINFSPGSGYLSISNKTGAALLYKLRYYDRY
ncbi:U3 small nucleolar RNA-associated protein 18 homolog [Odontomachus brunneus]|uniref:U3 small nucleolar RNA-associated protein 18 homolog n=1 Tax=Odontomachus brunneus TaxID=486640 RepID=UPI0013F1BD15|nr:U3 small nucleolar RNA-associated protein 18 homolog [Odontomachus brunneus]